mmetsp:Transcript_34192/g.71993  ORF Transcript_34192/g.71993 Transcript_34192/m.71993 type:complete len:387 (-) Transcript_34192:216-1376(-)
MGSLIWKEVLYPAMERETFLTHLVLCWLSAAASSPGSSALSSRFSLSLAVLESLLFATTNGPLLSSSLDLDLLDLIDRFELVDFVERTEASDDLVAAITGTSAFSPDLADLIDSPDLADFKDSPDFFDLTDRPDLTEALELVDRFDFVERTDASLLVADFNAGTTSSFFGSSSIEIEILTCSFSSPTSMDISDVDMVVGAGDGAVMPVGCITAFSSSVPPVVAVLSGLPSRTGCNLELMSATSFSSFAGSCSRSSFALVVLETSSVALESTFRMVRNPNLLLLFDPDRFFVSSLLVLLPSFLLRPRDLEREERHRLNILFRLLRPVLSLAFFFFFFFRKPLQPASSASDSGSDCSTIAMASCVCSGSSGRSGFGTKSAGRTVSTSS